jgi:hypothetical protein
MSRLEESVCSHCDDVAARRTRAATNGRSSAACGKRGRRQGPKFNWNRVPAEGYGLVRLS